MGERGLGGGWIMYLAQNNGLTGHFPSISLECPLNLPLIGHLVCVCRMSSNENCLVRFPSLVLNPVHVGVASPQWGSSKYSSGMHNCNKS